MMNKTTIAFGAALFALTATPAFAEGDKDKGKQLYQVCAACHGADGRGNPDTMAPQLAGQHGFYLTTQLKNFRDGIRGSDERDTMGAVMKPMAASLSDQDIADVVAYIGTMKPKNH